MVYITKSNSFLPGNPINNDQIEEVLGFVNKTPSKAKKIVLRSNGIKTRHYALDPETRKPTHTNAKLTALAVEGLLKDTKYDKEGIELLSCGTSCADQLLPSHATMVQGELNRNPHEVLSSAGVCCSSMNALKYAYLAILSGDKNNAVATGSEISSKLMRAENFENEKASDLEQLDKNKGFQFEQDFLRWMLSDGAGAFLLENAPNETGLSLKIEWIESISFANEAETCMYGGAQKDKDGNLESWLDVERKDVLNQKVLNISQDTKILAKNISYYTVNQAIPKFREKRNLKPEEVDWFIPHYSSDYFREKLSVEFAKIDFEIPVEKWFTTIASKGNIGSASIFIYLDDLINQHGENLKDGQKILCFIPESSRFSTSYMMLTVVKK
jgi:3-oxoacyl-[acyl-carrier-protein] synthase-3